MYTIFLATAGEDWLPFAPGTFHSSAPVSAWKASRLLFEAPIYTIPLSTAGEPVVAPPSVRTAQRSAPFMASKAYNFLSYESMYTVPLATAGEPSIAPPVAPTQSVLPDLASTAYSLPYLEPT